MAWKRVHETGSIDIGRGYRGCILDWCGKMRIHGVDCGKWDREEPAKPPSTASVKLRGRTIGHTLRCQCHDLKVIRIMESR